MKIIERVTNGITQALSPSKGSNIASKKKNSYLEKLIAKNVDPTINGKDLEYCLQAIRCLSAEVVFANSGYIRNLLKTWFNGHYSSAQGSLADNLRRSICWVDEALFKEEEIKSGPIIRRPKLLRRRK